MRDGTAMPPDTTISAESKHVTLVSTAKATRSYEPSKLALIPKAVSSTTSNDIGRSCKAPFWILAQSYCHTGLKYPLCKLEQDRSNSFHSC
jgi:hypothetical protein